MAENDPLDDNPPRLDTRADVRAFVRQRGHDPMDIDTEGQITEGNAILHDFAEDTPDERGGRSDFVVALEWERVESKANDVGIDLTPPDGLDVDEPFLDDF